MQGAAQPGEKGLLFVVQPRDGLHRLQPGRALRIVKGIFGLGRALRHCWFRFKKMMNDLKFDHRDRHARMLQQSLVDQALSVDHDREGLLFGIVCVHADDLLRAPGDKGMHEVVKNIFPFGRRAEPQFVFCGKEVSIDVHSRMLIRQKAFAQKLDPLALKKDRKRKLGVEATKVGVAENRSMLRALGCLCTQARPDLSTGVSMARRVQSTLGPDKVETNRIITDARRHAETDLHPASGWHACPRRLPRRRRLRERRRA